MTNTENDHYLVLVHNMIFSKAASSKLISLSMPINSINSALLNKQSGN